MRNLRTLVMAAALLTAVGARADVASVVEPSAFREFTTVLKCAHRTGGTTELTFSKQGPTWFEQLFAAFNQSCQGEVEALRRASAKREAILSPYEHSRFVDRIEFGIWHALLRANKQSPFLADFAPKEGLWAKDASDGSVIAKVQAHDYLFATIDNKSEQPLSIALRYTVGDRFAHLNLRGIAANFNALSWGSSPRVFEPKFEIFCNDPPFREGCRIDAKSIEIHAGLAYRIYVTSTGVLRICAGSLDLAEDDFHSATIDIDGEAVPLLTARGCSNELGPNWRSKLSQAQSIVSFVEHAKDADPDHQASDGAGLDAAIALANTLAKTRMTTTERLREQIDHIERVVPRTRFDLLKRTFSWRAAVGCLAKHNDMEACARALIDLQSDWADKVTLWHARYALSDISELRIKDIAQPRTAQSLLAENKFAPVIQALLAAKDQTPEGPMLDTPWSATFGTHERPTVLDGKPAHYGVSDDVIYAYAIDNTRASAVIHRYAGLQRNTQSITVECAAPGEGCTVTVPFQRGTGVFEIETHGDPWRSSLCVRDLRSAPESLQIVPSRRPWAYRPSAVKCFNSRETGALLHAKSGTLSVIERRAGQYEERAYAAMSGIETAIDLARFLTQRLHSR